MSATARRFARTAHPAVPRRPFPSFACSPHNQRGFTPPPPLIASYAFSASFRNGLNRSIGMGKIVVELFSEAIWFKVWR